MSNTNANFEITGSLSGQEIRKRKTPQGKIAIIQLTMEPGMNVSHVAHLCVIQPSCCLNGRSNIRKEDSLPLWPERKSCPPLNSLSL
jgi:transposase-like protein